MKNLLLLCLLFLPMSNSYSQQQKKTNVAVIDFQSSGGFEKSELTILTNRFRNMLVQTQAFEVVERDKMNEILKEQDFTLSDNCNSAECVVQVGQLLGVEAIIGGDVGLFGETYTIDLRMIDVTTGKILRTETQDYFGKRDGLLAVMQSMAQGLTGVASQRDVVRNYELTLIASSPLSDKVADILIDGKSIGKNFVKITIPEGKHSLTVKTDSPDLTIFTKEIYLTSNQTIEAKLDFTESYRQRVTDEATKAKQEAMAGEMKRTSKSSNKKLWYIIGGAAVIGGASAILLSGSNGKGSTKIPDMDLPPE